jgi:hypothetical protein
MTGIDYLIVLGSGYISVPFVSLINRRNWPTFTRFFIALGIAAAFTLVKLWTGNDPITDETFWLAFGPIFVMQQATFKLELPGAGSASVNEKLLEVPVLPA